MKNFLAMLLISVLAIGCRSVPIRVPDLPSDQLLVNQATFENAVQERIVGNCPKQTSRGTVLHSEPLGRRLLCETIRR